MNLFSNYKLSKEILMAIDKMGFEEPSPIQKASIPFILGKRDLIGQAQTGTGKTAAFGIPMIEMISKKPIIQGLVLTPTRELAIQVSEELRKIAAFKRLKILPIYGGQPIGRQIKALKMGIHIIIGTPGRVLDHLRRNTIHFKDIKYLVLDEADEMLDMGFIDDIKEIISKTPNDRQTLLFSATMPREIQKLAKQYLKKPKYIAINSGDLTKPSIEQIYYKVLDKYKLDSLCRIIDSHKVSLGIIFCRTKKSVNELTEALQARGYMADGIHGDLSQYQRNKVMRAFKEKSIEYLIATDVAARGIDIGDVSHVINYDIPQDPESYVHRIGRTGRADKKGVAITLVTPREIKQLRTIEKEIGSKITPNSLPTMEEIINLQQLQWKKQIQNLLDSNRNLSVFNNLLEELTSDYALNEVAAAALHLAFNEQTQNESLNDPYYFGETGAKQGMVKFFMNIGRNLELTPKKIVELVSEQIDMPIKDIGKINIFDRFSFIEVKEEFAPFVYEGLKNYRFNGYRIFLEPARPRS
ncbi:RNA helicase [Vulcanibacillus modesticaldus]|uniref:ATP-dependent RNA helicase CshA n=1 Tax=Vulcanibacillus modesticaldus TaxID=337097 RepID=A0A1D2YXR1_9BACI|nr:DEAD/DEAH box helicase [Vulcanibacillus modesticaldus]OEG00473.1 RNA helicase [Vulcanibacillus modesticaldus]